MPNFEVIIEQTIVTSFIVDSEQIKKMLYSRSRLNPDLADKELGKEELRSIFDEERANTYLIADLHEQQIPNSGMLTIHKSSSVEVLDEKK